MSTYMCVYIVVNKLGIRPGWAGKLQCNAFFLAATFRLHGRIPMSIYTHGHCSAGTTRCMHTPTPNAHASTRLGAWTTKASTACGSSSICTSIGARGCHMCFTTIASTTALTIHSLGISLGTKSEFLTFSVCCDSVNPKIHNKQQVPRIMGYPRGPQLDAHIPQLERPGAGHSLGPQCNYQLDEPRMFTLLVPKFITRVPPGTV